MAAGGSRHHGGVRGAFVFCGSHYRLRLFPRLLRRHGASRQGSPLCQGLFDAPGESDLTAHVDFMRLKQAASDAHLKAFGPMPMGEWLLRLGLETRVRKLLSRASDVEAGPEKPRHPPHRSGADGCVVQGACLDQWRLDAAAPVLKTQRIGCHTASAVSELGILQKKPPRARRLSDLEAGDPAKRR